MQLLFIQSHAPFTDLAAQEGLDAALVAAAFDQSVTLLFVDDGVYQLLTDQSGEQIERFSAASPISALHLYEIKRLCVCMHSLEARGLKADDVLASCGELGADFLTSTEIGALINEHDRALSF